MVSDRLNGVFRSLRIYYGDKEREMRMDRIYGQFLANNDLAFDIGSHVGDRTASFRRLGARVIALEPQPLLYRTLRLIHGADEEVVLLQQACGASLDEITFYINSSNPTVSTASSDFIASADGASGWQDQSWDQKLDVPVKTLDVLIDKHGVPDFVKIDVEGFEGAVLKGLSHPLKALSFEFTTIQRDVAFECLDILSILGLYTFNVILGESYEWESPEWLSALDMKDLIQSLPHEANSGDIYAILPKSP